MRKTLFILFSCLIFFCSCHPKKGLDRDTVAMETYKKKLEQAKKVLGKTDEKVKKLRQGLLLEEVHWIERRVDSFESFLAKLSSEPDQYKIFLDKEFPTLFLKEREDLMSLMQNSPEVEKESREVLDRILRLITKLGDQRQSQERL